MVVINIRRFLEKNGMTINEFASKAGVSAKVIRKLLYGGIRSFSPESISKVATAIGTSTDVLVNGIADEEQRQTIAGLIKNSHEYGVPAEKIADMLNVEESFVRNAIDSCGAEEKSGVSEESRQAEPLSEGDIIRLYADGMSYHSIASRIGMSDTFVKTIISRAEKEGKVTRRQHASPHKMTDSQIEQAVAMYKNGQTCAKIAAEFGVSRTTVLKRLKERGLSMRGRGGKTTQEQREKAISMYCEGYSRKAISKELGVGMRTITKITAPFKDKKNAGYKETVRKAGEMYISGFSIFEISESLERSYPTASRLVWKAFPEDGGESGITREEAVLRHNAAQLERKSGLTFAEIEEVIRMYSDGLPVGDICERFDITLDTLYSIVSGTRLKGQVATKKRQPEEQTGENSPVSGDSKSCVAPVIKNGNFYKMRVRMPYEKQEEVVRMHAEGISPARISKSTGVGLNTIPFILYEAGRSINYRKVDKAVRLYSEGYSLPRIAKILGTSLDYVKRTIKKEKMRGSVESRDHVGSYKLTDAQIAQAVKMRESGCSAAQIAKIFGVNEKTIRNYVRMEKQDDGKGKPAQFASGSYILTKEQLAAAARMREEGQTIQKIAESFGVGQTTIGRHLRNAGVYKGATITKKKEDEIVRLYSDGYSVRRITEKTGASTRTIKNVISEAISSGRATRRAHGGSYKLTEAQIAQAVKMRESGCSASQIAKAFGVTGSTIRNYVRMVKAKQADNQQ